MAAGWRQNAEYWRQLPALSTARFLGAVFCLFASVSFIFFTVSVGQANLTSSICFSLVNGFAATLWAVTGTRRMFKAMGVVACLQAATNIWLSTVFNKGGGIPATVRYFRALRIFQCGSRCRFNHSGILAVPLLFQHRGRALLRHFDRNASCRCNPPESGTGNQHGCGSVRVLRLLLAQRRSKW